MLFFPCKIHFKINNEKQNLVISRFIFQSKNCKWTLGFSVKIQNSILGQKSKIKFFSILFLILNWHFPYKHYQKSVHQKCHSIFNLKLEWEMTFLCISISTQNWKLKKGNFQFSIFIEKLKYKVFMFFAIQFSFYFKILNYHLSN